MENIEDFFKIEPVEIIEMSSSDFFTKTKELLERIAKNYSCAWSSKSLKDDEFPDESICDKCTGCGTFIKDGEQQDCFQDKEEGWCYYRFFDAECFGEEVEAEMEDIWTLLCTDKLI